jgi:katanin p80 WD40 repeat-containing subunit B1
MEMISDSRREPSAGRVSPFRIQSRYAELRKLTHAKTDSNKVDSGSKITETDDFNCQIFIPRRNGVFQTISSEESREDVKCGPVDRMGFSNSSEPNASVRSENCMICTHLYVLCAATT